ncbi:cytochrome P450 [Saccharopolyspora sp. NFXS83]|uniref:cytochrome P450 n=1 Tax=Saccharopolyspora sp. NFXS83 TaxID=2993560 RepID=UPI00224AFD24|nr:cytochrome P450 [Saccharopolyspora sp. NFXS83]MCX2729166.1 cytochrome P450 [Saccharopolyspora sp. NFXS83]
MPEAVPTAPALPMTRGCPFDPPPELGALRERHPVSRMTFPDGHVGWLITGYDAVRRLLADRRVSSRGDLLRSPIPLPMAADRTEVSPGMFTAMDPPEHTRYRHLIAGWFTVRRTRELEPRISEIVEEHLDVLANSERPVDLVRTFAEPVSAIVISELLGVPADRRQRFLDATAALFAVHTSAEEAIAGWLGIRELLLELVRAKQAEPASDLLGTLVSSGSLDDEELITVGSLLLTAGHDTSTNMIALGTYALLTNEDQFAALRDDPELVPRAVEELLRYLTIVHAGSIRAASEGFEFDGHQIAGGDALSLSLVAANRDPALCPEPDRLDITREPVNHLAFGHGVHQCVGAQLARIELRTAFAALVRRFPGLRLAVPADEIRLRSEMIIYGVHELPVAW